LKDNTILKQLLEKTVSQRCKDSRDQILHSCRNHEFKSSLYCPYGK